MLMLLLITAALVQCSLGAPPPDVSVELCTSGSQTYHRNKNNCKSFYQCHNGNAIPKSCPGPTVYSSIAKSCVHPGSYWDDCTHHSSTETPIEETSQSTSPVFGPDDLCTSGNEKYHRNSEDCKSFYQCSNGQAYLMRCTIKTVFSTITNTCVHPGSQFDNCTTFSQITPEDRNNYEQYAIRECARGIHDLLPHPTACQRYYNCSKVSRPSRFSYFGRYEEECPYPEVFDILELKCTSYKTGICGDGRPAAKDGCDYFQNKCPRSHCIPCSQRFSSCVGKSDGPNVDTGRPWSSRYAICQDERFVEYRWCGKSRNLDITMRFSPVMNKCVTVFEIPRRYGGAAPSCVGKSPGYHRIGSIGAVYYRCPDEAVFYCSSRAYYFDESTQKCQRYNIPAA